MFSKKYVIITITFNLVNMQSSGTFVIGFGGLYQGVTATIMKQGSNQAIRFFVMETFKDWYRGGDNTKPVPKPVVGCFGAVAGNILILNYFNY